MAYKVFVKTKGNTSGAYKGQSEHKKVQGVSELDKCGEEWSDCISLNYKLHQPIDKGRGTGTGQRHSEPLRLLFEMDGNYARYVSSLIDGERMTLELYLVRNAEEGNHEKSMTLMMTTGTISEVNLATGRPGSEGSMVSKTTAQYDTPELYEVLVSYERLEGKAFMRGKKDGIPWIDDWKNPGTSKG